MGKTEFARKKVFYSRTVSLAKEVTDFRDGTLQVATSLLIVIRIRERVENTPFFLGAWETDPFIHSYYQTPPFLTSLICLNLSLSPSTFLACFYVKLLSPSCRCFCFYCRALHLFMKA